jgi:hypothetical protein
MKIADALLPEFDQEMANTRKTLERIPETPSEIVCHGVACHAYRQHVGLDG